MPMLRRFSLLAALAAWTIALTGCERQIYLTEVSQQPETCFTSHSDADTRLAGL